MIKILLVLIYSVSSFALDIGLEFSVPEVKQGSIITAQIKLDAPSAQEIPLQKLKSKTFAETIYVYDVGTPIRKEGRLYFEADAKVIFLKVPESNQLTFNDEGVGYKVFWNEVKVLPTTEEKSFLYGSFTIPSRFKSFKWIFAFIGLIVVSLVGGWCYRIFNTRNLKKKKLQEVKLKLVSAQSYEDIVQVWMNRQNYLMTFPVIDEAFRKLELNLFKVQFKPQQSEQEKIFVIDSYKDFLNSIKGSLDGI